LLGLAFFRPLELKDVFTVSEFAPQNENAMSVRNPVENIMDMQDDVIYSTRTTATDRPQHSRTPPGHFMALHFHHILRQILADALVVIV